MAKLLPINSISVQFNPPTQLSAGTMNPQTLMDPNVLNTIAGGLAVAIFVGGFLMMYTTLWTRR